MIRKYAMAALSLGCLLSGVGCASCGYEACQRAIEAGPDCTTPLADRRHVYMVMVNGLTPSGGLEELRLKLAEHGYEKTFRGELCHSWWLWSEMKRVHRCEPEARFMMVGYGFGCPEAAGLARDAAREGIPVDAVVYLDPAGPYCSRDAAERTLVIKSGKGAETEPNTVRVADCSHFALPTHEQTVQSIAVVLAETAMRVEHPPYQSVPMFWHPDAPPRRDYSLPDGGLPEQWRFLHERFGPHSSPLVAAK